MWNEGMAHSWGWVLFGGLHMLVFWLLIILLIAALVKWLRTPDPSNDGRQRSASELLDERLARGEIDLEMYKTLKSELSKER